MAGILIRGCGIVTMNDERAVISAGDLHIENDRITHVGPALAAPPAPERSDVEVIDGRGKVALPGFVNAHHHLFMSLLRGMSPNDRLPGWLSGCILPAGVHLRPEDLYWSIRLSLAECIESGVTSTMDWSFNLHGSEHAAATFEAMRDSGMRVHFAYGPGMVRSLSDFDIRIADFEDIRARLFGGAERAGRIRLWAGLGGPELQDETRFREEFALARSYGLSVHIHLREVNADSVGVVGKLDEWGVLGPHLLLAHAIHMNDDELDILARTDTRVSYNPLSNMRLGSGICRTVEMRQRGMGVALGLDGSACCDNNDFFALMRAAAGLQRARHMSADCVTVDDVLAMATVEGARALGDGGDVGVLKPGAKADVILINPDTINFAPLNNFVAQTVFSGQPRNVDTVIVDGRVLKRGGQLAGTNVEEILAKCRAASNHVVKAAGLERTPILAV